jgi:hypothetical protein
MFLHENRCFFKVWWHNAILFVYFDIMHIQYYTFIPSHSSIVIRRGSSPSPHYWLAQWEKPPWGAEPRIELEPALRQADALSTELRHTL